MAKKRSNAAASKLASKPRVVQVVEDDEDDELDALVEEPTDEITDNASEVPLFADVDGRTLRSISKLRLYRVENGGLAYKGELPTTSTLETIGQVYGDGVYAVEGVNHRGNVLYTKDNIRISLAGVGTDKALTSGAANEDRIERLARQSANESHENNRAFVQLITSTQQAQAERDAARMDAQLTQMQTFFSSLMTMQNQQHQQTIAMMTASNAATLQMMTTQTQRPRGENNQLQLVDTLLRGLRMGRELADGREPGEPPAWQSILQGGLGVLAQVTPKADASASPGAVHSGQSQPPPAGSQSLLAALPAAHKRTLRDALKLHRAVTARGIDPTSLLKELSIVRTDAPVVLAEAPAPQEPNEDEEQDEPEDDEDESESDDDEGDDEDDFEADDDEPADVRSARAPNS